MAVHLTAQIPRSRVEKIGVWSNEAAKTTMANVVKQLKGKYPDKEVYIVNGGLFDMNSTLKACIGLKADGKIYANDWSIPYMGMKGSTIAFCPNGTPNSFTDAVSGYPVLIENGKKSKNFAHVLDNSDRGRSMIGFSADKIIFSCIGDIAGNSDFTLDEELAYMLSLKCDYAINLDGGGSSQCNFNGATINSSRKVSNFVYMIVTPDTTNPIEHKKNLQKWLNSTYKAGLDVDGSLGPLSLKAMIKGMQTEVKVVADGIWGAKSNKAFKYLGLNSPNNTTNKIKILQGLLARKGYWDFEMNGVADNKLDTQIKAYQKANKLEVDGLVGTATLGKLLK